MFLVTFLYAKTAHTHTHARARALMCVCVCVCVCRYIFVNIYFLIIPFPPPPPFFLNSFFIVVSCCLLVNFSVLIHLLFFCKICLFLIVYVVLLYKTTLYSRGLLLFILVSSFIYFSLLTGKTKFPFGSNVSYCYELYRAFVKNLLCLCAVSVAKI